MDELQALDEVLSTLEAFRLRNGLVEAKESTPNYLVKKAKALAYDEVRIAIEALKSRCLKLRDAEMEEYDRAVALKTEQDLAMQAAAMSAEEGSVKG